MTDTNNHMDESSMYDVKCKKPDFLEEMKRQDQRAKQFQGLRDGWADYRGDTQRSIWK